MKPAPSSFALIKDHQPQNLQSNRINKMGFKQGFIKNVGNTLKSTAKMISENPVNKDLLINERSFEISGLIAYPIVEDYQDQSFKTFGSGLTTQKTQSKFTRNKSKLMALPKKFEGKDYDQIDIVPLQYISKL